MLMLMMTNYDDIALKFKVTIHFLFVFSQIIVLIIHIRPNSKDPLFGTALLLTTLVKKYHVFDMNISHAAVSISIFCLLELL